MKCPQCTRTLRIVDVAVAGARQKARSYQCPGCDYFMFEPVSSRKVLAELRDTPLRIRQKIVKLSKDRLGMYFNTHIVESLGLEKGESIHLSVPDKKHILIELS